MLQVAQWLRPLSSLLCWWHPFRYRETVIVLLPDSMAIFMIAFGGLWLLPYAGWNSVWIYCLALLVSPFWLLAAVLIDGAQVKVVRLFGPVPYWIHKISDEAKFDLYQGWEDTRPTGVSFGVSASDSLHLGTARSAEALYRHVGEVLERAGWRQTASGWERDSCRSRYSDH